MAGPVLRGMRTDLGQLNTSVRKLSESFFAGGQAALAARPKLAAMWRELREGERILRVTVIAWKLKHAAVIVTATAISRLSAISFTLLGIFTALSTSTLSLRAAKTALKDAEEKLAISTKDVEHWQGEVAKRTKELGESHPKTIEAVKALQDAMNNQRDASNTLRDAQRDLNDEVARQPALWASIGISIASAAAIMVLSLPEWARLVVAFRGQVIPTLFATAGAIGAVNIAIGPWSITLGRLLSILGPIGITIAGITIASQTFADDTKAVFIPAFALLGAAAVTTGLALTGVAAAAGAALATTGPLFIAIAAALIIWELFGDQITAAGEAYTKWAGETTTNFHKWVDEHLVGFKDAWESYISWTDKAREANHKWAADAAESLSKWVSDVGAAVTNAIKWIQDALDWWARLLGLKREAEAEGVTEREGPRGRQFGTMTVTEPGVFRLHRREMIIPATGFEGFRPTPIGQVSIALTFYVSGVQDPETLAEETSHILHKKLMLLTKGVKT